MADDNRYIDEERRKLIDRTRESWLYRTSMDLMWKAMWCLLPISPVGWYLMKDSPSIREFLLRREARIGLLGGSIIQNSLWIPEYDGNDLVEHKATGGKWFGYDFRREEEFGKQARPVKRGKLISLIPDEIKPLSPLAYTPTGSIHPFIYEHCLHLEMPSIDYLVENGVVEHTTYGEAFDRVGMLGRYAWNLSKRELTDLPVFQVTPKGNGIIYLDEPGGKKVTKELKEPQKTPVLLPNTVPI